MKNQKGSSSNSSVDIPMDIIFAILSLLPVKSLLRFRCVNKQWLALIHSPRFTSMHKTLHSADFTYLVIKKMSIFQWDAFFFGNRKPLDDVCDLLSNQFLSFECSCDGLLLFSLNTVEIIYSSVNRQCSLLIWNPCTGKCMPIDTCTHFDFGHVVGYGFGSCKLDGGTADDYKIMARLYVDQRPLLYVYTLSTHEWKEVATDQVRYRERMPDHRSVSINGIVYWVSKKEASEGLYLRVKVIKSFDLQREIFGEMSFPEGSGAANMLIDLFVGNYRHCLSLVTYNPDSRMLSAWVLVKKHGVDADHCWEELFAVSIAPTLVLKTYSGTRVSMIDTCDYSDLVFDIESQQWSQLGVNENWDEVIAYNESLSVSLDEIWQR